MSGPGEGPPARPSDQDEVNRRLTEADLMDYMESEVTTHAPELTRLVQLLGDLRMAHQSRRRTSGDSQTQLEYMRAQLSEARVQRASTFELCTKQQEVSASLQRQLDDAHAQLGQHQLQLAASRLAALKTAAEAEDRRHMAQEQAASVSRGPWRGRRGPAQLVAQDSGQAAAQNAALVRPSKDEGSWVSRISSESGYASQAGSDEFNVKLLELEDSKASLEATVEALQAKLALAASTSTRARQLEGRLAAADTKNWLLQRKLQDEQAAAAHTAKTLRTLEDELVMAKTELGEARAHLASSQGSGSEQEPRSWGSAEGNQAIRASPRTSTGLDPSSGGGTLSGGGTTTLSGGGTTTLSGGGTTTFSGDGERGSGSGAPAGAQPQAYAQRSYEDSLQDGSLMRISREGHGPADSPPLEFTVASLPPGLREWVINPADVRVLYSDNGQRADLGAGAYGCVYKVEYQGEVVACKEVPLDSSASGQIAFVKEALRMVQLRHPHIVGFTGVAVSGTKGLLLMEYCENRDLYTQLNIRRGGSSDERVFSWYRRGRQVACEVARALNYLHSRGIVHMDIKASNVLLTQHLSAKLADVGFARSQTRTCLSDITSSIGTFAWIAPEILMGGKNCTLAVDLYSFGVLLWEIVTGETPRRGDMRPLRVPEECPQAVDDLIERCCDSDPRRRITAKELLKELAVLALEPPKPPGSQNSSQGRMPATPTVAGSPAAPSQASGATAPKESSDGSAF